MDNELYYNKYLFKQSGGRNIPISTYDQIGGDIPPPKSDNIIESILDNIEHIKAKNASN